MTLLFSRKPDGPQDEFTAEVHGYPIQAPNSANSGTVRLLENESPLIRGPGRVETLVGELENRFEFFAPDRYDQPDLLTLWPRAITKTSRSSSMQTRAKT
jgi:hypothetical protein